MDAVSKVVVIGASAGGLKAVTELLSKFSPGSNNIAFFVVLHVAKHSMGEVIVNHIQRHTSLKCRIPEKGEVIKAGHLYLAPPDHHMIIKGKEIVINNGPHENRWRPSIDVLFRSAAVAYNSKVIGIILTGLLDDGTSGMGAIKRSGGICMVQEPEEAEFGDMPNNVLNNVDVDFRVPLGDMGYILNDLFSKPSGEAIPVPREVQIEAEITERLATHVQDLAQIGEQSLFNCPDCGGGLFKVNDPAVNRYRCHTGHVYTEKTLLQVQSEHIEETLWVAMRMLEERRNLLLTVSGREKENGTNGEWKDKQVRADEINVHIERLKHVLQTISVNEPND
jgi:two-component system chemotaxis response regulator CheB